jgi:hypothetical protein
MLFQTPRASFQKVFVTLSVLFAWSALVFVRSSAAQTTVTVSPTTASLRVPGGTQQFTATVTTSRRNHSVRWSLSGGGCSGSTCGALSANSSNSGVPITYTAPASVPNPATVTLTATSSSNSSRRASATITLTTATAPLQITTTSLPNGQVGTVYSATLTVTGGATPYSWSLTSGTLPAGLTLRASTGAITGMPTAAVNATPLTFTVTDSSSPVQSKSVSLTLSITATNVTVAVSPKRAALAVTQALSLTATTTDVNGVNWLAIGTGCSGSACGTFSFPTTASGVPVTYTAPSVAGVYTIIATSVTNGSTSASLVIGVTDLSGVLTYHNNLSRDGTNTQEFALTTSIVNTSTFGKLFSCTVDGAIYTQPLWIPNLTVAGAKHSLIVVATQHNGLYAFDADTAPCTILWHANLIDSAHGGTAGETSVPSSGTGALVGSGYGDIAPEVGVTGTPVIDPTTNTLYVVSKSVNTITQFFQRLHALDLTTGNERVTPKSIDSSISVPGTGAGSVNGQVTFDPRNENQRPGLVLSNGVVYVAWASHEDHDPYHGWVIGFSASTLAPITNGVFNSTPNVVGTLSYSRGGVWMGGGAPAVDSTGNLYLITGNGTFDANAGGSNYGDSVVKLSTKSGLAVADYFTPLDQASLDANDTDFGSGAATVLVDQPTAPVPHLVIGGGKQGNLFLLNRENLGKFNSSTNNVVETVNLGNSIFATPVFWQNNFYVAGVGNLKQFVFNPSTGQFNGAPSSQSSTSYGFPGATPSLSSSGTTNAIIWALENTLYCTPQSPGCSSTVLHAYDATNLATELWNSSQAVGNRDHAGNAVKFTVPTVANGKVYVGTRGNNTGGADSSSTVPGELEVYGLLPN